MLFQIELLDLHRKYERFTDLFKLYVKLKKLAEDRDIDEEARELIKGILPDLDKACKVCEDYITKEDGEFEKLAKEEFKKFQELGLL